MIDLNRLRTLRAVFAEGSVNRAAANLGFTPSAVSQQIHALQRDLGVDLFERRGRGITPTANGRRIAEEAETVLTQAIRLEELAADLRVGRTGSLAVSHVTSVGAVWMPDIAQTLGREFPDLRLDLRPWEHTHDSPDEPDVEIYVKPLTPPSQRETAGYDVEELASEPYIVVLPVKHRLAGRAQVALSELTAEDWVDNDVADGPCRQVLMAACASRGFIPSFRLETQNEGAAVAFVEAGSGITVMPELTFHATRPDTSRVTCAALVDPTPQRTLMMRTRQSLTGNPAVCRLRELVRARAAAESGLQLSA